MMKQFSGNYTPEYSKTMPLPRVVKHHDVPEALGLDDWEALIPSSGQPKV